MKVDKEWFVPAPWGKIALISWGNPSGEPVLLVHGRQDSAATFIPLLEYLPDNYYYVGIDMPGNGRSDPFPVGVKLSRFHFIAAVEYVIKELKWNTFIYIGHSMGCEQGLFFNVIYPNHIKKAIYLDLGPSLQRLQIHDMVEYYQMFYKNYYENYHSDNYSVKLYTKTKAIEAVKRARGLNEEQAEMILSRNMIPVSDGQFRLSWDKRLHMPAPQNFPVDYYIKLFSKKCPPSLLIAASDVTSRPYMRGKEDAAFIINSLKNNLENFKMVTVQGGHDVHFTNPERVGGYVKEFLIENDFKCKL